MPSFPLGSRKRDKSNARLWANEDFKSSESDEGQASTPSINSPRPSQPPGPDMDMDMDMDISTKNNNATSTSTQPIKKSEIIRMDYRKAKIAIAPSFRPKLPSLEELNKDLEEIEKCRAMKIKEEMEKSKKDSTKTDALIKSSKSKQKKRNSSWDLDLSCNSLEMDKGSAGAAGEQKCQDRSDKNSATMLWKNKNGHNDDFFLY